MKIIGIIPARKGSKRLKHKNIYSLKGTPLIGYSIQAALGSKYLNTDNLYISSNFDAIKELADLNGIKYITRPEHLADGTTWTQEVINHVDENVGFDSEDIIVILQANSPQMTSKKIDECIDMLINHKLWQVNTVGKDMINNGAIQVIKRFVREHKGKVNYNGIVLTDWIDVHTIEDIRTIEQLWKDRT